VCFNDFRGCSSNVLDVEVIQPTGGEKEALTLFQEAYRLHWSCGDKSTEKWEEAFHTYKELAEKFPGSVYAPVALRLALARGNVIEDKRVVIGVAKKLIEEHPASPYLALGFLYLIDNYRLLHDKVGATKYMKELIAKYPGSEVSTRAEYWLDRIENLEF
jgi:outer membrane protein assembly factor BamD (BamD/ComL family)